MSKRRKTKRTRRERLIAKPIAQAGGVSSKYFLPVLLFVVCNDAPVRQWEAYNPIIIGGLEQVMKQVDPNAPEPPANMGIKWR